MREGESRTVRTHVGQCHHNARKLSEDGQLLRVSLVVGSHLMLVRLNGTALGALLRKAAGVTKE